MRATQWLAVGLVAMLSLVARASGADVISIEESQQRAAQAAAEKECAGKPAQTPCAIGKSKGMCVAATCSRAFSEFKDGRAIQQTRAEPCTQCNATPAKPGDERASRCSVSVVGRGLGGGSGLGSGAMVVLGLLLARGRRKGRARARARGVDA
jgi:hypothetical protein